MIARSSFRSLSHQTLGQIISLLLTDVIRKLSLNVRKGADAVIKVG